MFESLTFANPLLWWGATAAAVPFIIHWMMRPRPQKVVFPATFLLQKALAEGQKAQRLRNIWLLIVRALGLVLIAGLLAGPTCNQEEAGSLRDDRPIAAVLVIDDGWSCAYQLSEDETVVDRLRQVALGIVAEARDWPTGSTLGMIRAGAPATGIAPTAQVERVEDQLQQLRDPTAHANTLRHALGQAGEWLRTAGPPRRRLILLSDLAGHSLRDVTPDSLGAIENLKVQAMPVIDAPRTNLALQSVRGPSGILAETAPVTLEVTVRSEGAAARAVLVVQNEDRVLLRSNPIELPPDQSVVRRLRLPRFPRGVHGLQVRLEPDDRLPHDQVRYVAFEVGPPPEVWLVDPTAAEVRTLTSHLLENLLAPPGLPAEHQLVTLRRISSDAIPQGDAAPPLILVPSGLNLSDAARGRLRDLVERGSQLVLLPAPGARIDWPGLRRYFAARVEPVAMETASPWNWDPDARVSEDVRVAWSNFQVDTRVDLVELADSVEVQASFQDGQPSLLRRSFGRGALHLLTTSPDPAWSNLGTRALGLLGWLLELTGGNGERLLVADRLSGTPLQPGLAGLPNEGSVRVQPVGAGDARTVRIGGGDQQEVTAQPGLLRLRARDQVDRLVSLNWPEQESDLEPLPVERLAAALGVAEVTMVGAQAASTEWNWQTALARPAEWFALGLLVILALELVLSEWRLERRKARVES